MLKVSCRWSISQLLVTAVWGGPTRFVQKNKQLRSLLGHVGVTFSSLLGHVGTCLGILWGRVRMVLGGFRGKVPERSETTKKQTCMGVFFLRRAAQINHFGPTPGQTISKL